MHHKMKELEMRAQISGDVLPHNSEVHTKTVPLAPVRGESYDLLKSCMR